jgi:glucose-1-phosphate adenylyltransferase
MTDVLSLILGGGRGDLLYPLTKDRSKAAVPLAGKYRFIDIPLSNCLNSGLNRVFVLTQMLSVSLHRHIANTYKFDAFGHGFVEVLAAQQTNETADWYQGTADAIRQNLRYLREEGARHVLILSDDQLYRFDFRQLLEAHLGSRADVTLGVVPVPRAEASRLGVIRLDSAGKVIGFREKPRTDAQLDEMRMPTGWLNQRGVFDPDREYLANMGIYLFNRDVLFDFLLMQPPANDLAAEVLPRVLRSHHLQAYLFPGYWQHLDSLSSYHEANLALAGDKPPFDFHSPEGVIYTRMRNLPASRLSDVHMEQCLVSDGCVVAARTRMERCVLGVRSLVGRDVTLRDAVLMGANWYDTSREQLVSRKRGLPDLGVGDDSVLERIIVDKNCRIGRNVRIVNRGRPREGEGDNYVIREGIVVIPNGAVIPDGTVI